MRISFVAVLIAVTALAMDGVFARNDVNDLISKRGGGGKPHNLNSIL